MDNKKFWAMLCLEGRRKEVTGDTQKAEAILKELGWTDNMIRVWRNRRIPLHMRSRS